MESLFRLKLEIHFKDHYTEKSNTKDQYSKPQSDEKWIPNKNHQSIKTYIEATERELKQQGDICDKKGYENLSKGETIAKKELRNHTDITIFSIKKEQ